MIESQFLLICVCPPQFLWSGFGLDLMSNSPSIICSWSISCFFFCFFYLAHIHLWPFPEKLIPYGLNLFPICCIWFPHLASIDHPISNTCNKDRNSYRSRWIRLSRHCLEKAGDILRCKKCMITHKAITPALTSSYIIDAIIINWKRDFFASTSSGTVIDIFSILLYPIVKRKLINVWSHIPKLL